MHPRVTRMNRLATTLLAVLVVVGVANGFLVWNADRHARDDAERQACIARAEAVTIVGVVAPTLVASADDVDQAAQLQAISRLSAELDEC